MRQGDKRGKICDCVVLLHNAVPIKRIHPISAQAVRGKMPQGSLCSPYIVSKLTEAFIAPLKPKLAITYIDDIFLAERTESVAQATQDALHSALAEHPAGPLLLKKSVVHRVGAFEPFLGYYVRWRSPIFGGGVRLTPSAHAIHKGQQRALRSLIFSAVSCHQDFLEEFARRWSSEQASWDGRKAGACNFELSLLERVAPLARKINKQVRDEGLIFDSFRAMKEFAAERATLLPADPAYPPSKTPSLSSNSG